MSSATDALLLAAQAVLNSHKHPWGGAFTGGKTPQEAALIDLEYAVRMIEAERLQGPPERP